MKIKTVYQCTSCGYQSPKWAGKCPDCGEWNTLAETAQIKGGAKAAKAAPKQPVSRLSEVETGSDQRLLTGIAEFDRVMGGGIVRDSVTIITSPPGGGKSTLSLMAASALAKQGFRVLYASGEESDSQIKNRADRILDTIAENIWIVADTSMDNVLDAIREIDPDLIILDSIQTFSLAEFLPSRAGNPTQTMECASALVAQAKNTLTVPNAAIVRGGYVLVTQDSPSAVNADPGMIAPDGYVYVPVKTGVSDDNYTQIVSGLTGNDTVAYDSAAASTDTYYDDGGYYEADAEGTEGEEGADAANSMVDEEEPENGTVPAEEPVEAEEKQGSAGDDVNPSQADGVVYLG